MGRNRIYNLYFSYGWNYRHTLDEVLEHLQARKGFSLLPYHFPYQDRNDGIGETELYRMVRDKIKHSDAVLLLCGLYSDPTYNRWIRKEIISATGEYDKPLIAVHRYPELKISPIVRQSADIIVEWDGKQDLLADTIRRIARR